jgi:hypothetical protein
MILLRFHVAPLETDASMAEVIGIKEGSPVFKNAIAESGKLCGLVAKTPASKGRIHGSNPAGIGGGGFLNQFVFSNDP